MGGKGDRMHESIGDSTVKSTVDDEGLRMLVEAGRMGGCMASSG